MSVLSGFKSNDLENRGRVEPATAQYIGRKRTAVDVNAQVGYKQVVNDTAEAGSDVFTIVATAHLARKGDCLLFSTDDLCYVQDTTTNTITLSQALTFDPVGFTFDILRPTPVIVSSSGSIVPTASSATQSYPTCPIGNSTLVLAANPNRISYSVQNNSGHTVYLSEVAGASTTNHKVTLFTRDYYENNTYKGDVYAICLTASVSLNICEEVP